MKIDVRIATLKEEIRNAKKELNEILDKAIKHSAPKGYSEGSSYEDYDCIHGTKKKVDIERLLQDIDRLKVFIEINESILKSLEKNKNIREKLNEIEDINDKIIFLKQLGYTNEEVAEECYISVRQLYRRLRNMKEND
jgi:hypothetical protein